MVSSRRRRPPSPFDRPPTLAPRAITHKPRAWWRVHPKRFRATQFHPGASGDARFSPSYLSGGAPIPSLYAASTLQAALLETVLHDVPAPPAGFILDLDRLRDEEFVVSRVRAKRALRLIDLSTPGLKRLGLARADLIDTPVARYPYTRTWAEWLHAQGKPRGLAWVPRQDERARALALFGDRVTESAFAVEVDREPLWESPHLDSLLELAERIGIDRIDGL